MTAVDHVPDPRDGLTAIERALLLAAEPSEARRTKCRPVVDAAGEAVPGHTHEVLYDALVRMAVPHVSRCELLDGEGNYGFDDQPADSKYTEVRRSAAGEPLFGDTLPLGGSVRDLCRGAFPAMLVNGSPTGDGAFPPHNLGRSREPSLPGSTSPSEVSTPSSTISQARTTRPADGSRIRSRFERPMRPDRARSPCGASWRSPSV